jgi:hypothetical protein
VGSLSRYGAGRGWILEVQSSAKAEYDTAHVLTESDKDDDVEEELVAQLAVQLPNTYELAFEPPG